MSTAVSTGPLPGPIDVLVTGHPKDGELEAIVQGGVMLVPFAGLSLDAQERLRARPDLRVYNLHDNAVDVAELGLGMLLALSRRIVPLDRELREGRWDPNSGVRLAGKRALIVGYGAIGREMAARLGAMRMYLCAIRRTGPFGHDTTAEVHPLRALDLLLPAADVLVNCLPLTPATEGLFDETRLRMLPADALVINLGRGATMDESALYEALRDGHLGGAGLDVWWRYGEDRPSHEPFHELDNVVLSPHRGGGVDVTESERAEAVDAMLRTLASGEVPTGRVSVEHGY